VAILHDDIVAPPPPDNPQADPGQGEIVVNWSRPAAVDIVGYKVLVATAVEGPYTQVHSGTLPELTTSYTFPAASGQTYYVGVAAVDQAGNQGAMSAPVDVVMP